MIILGISDGRDAAAALTVDGELVAAVEQERIDRKRHSGAFPSGAMDAVLDVAGVRARDVDRVVAGGAGRPELSAGVAAALRRTGLHMVGYELVRRRLEPRLAAAGYRASVEVVEADRAQVQAAYRGQPHETALVVMVDGAADGAAISVDLARAGHLERVFLQSTLAPLAGLPARAAGRLGIDVAQLGARAVGAAPAPLVTSLEALVGLDGLAFRSQRPGRGPDPVDRLAAGVDPEDFARAARAVVEEAVAGFVRAWIARSGIADVVLAGTLFLDPGLAGRVAREPSVRHLSVCPAPGGAAAALGAALGAAGTSPRALALTLGPGWDDQGCYRALSAAELPRDRVADPDAEAGRRIAAGQLVARFAGRLPFGPRPLGLRSILCRVDRAEAAAAAKRRLPGIPIGCLVRSPGPTSDRVDLTDGTIAVRPGAGLPDGLLLHADGTALPTLTRDPGLLRLLAAAGSDVVAETSLNLAGEPMACSPGDAIRAFRATGCDALLLGDYLVEATGGSSRQKDPKPTQSSPAR